MARRINTRLDLKTWATITIFLVGTLLGTACAPPEHAVFPGAVAAEPAQPVDLAQAADPKLKPEIDAQPAAAHSFSLWPTTSEPLTGEDCGDPHEQLAAQPADATNFDATTARATGYVTEGRLTHFVRQTDGAALVLIHCRPEFAAWLDLVSFASDGQIVAEPTRLTFEDLTVIETTGLVADTAGTATVSARLHGPLQDFPGFEGVFNYDITVDLSTGGYDVALTDDLDPEDPNATRLVSESTSRFDYRLVHLPGATDRYHNCDFEQPAAMLFVRDATDDAGVFEVAWREQLEVSDFYAVTGARVRFRVGCNSLGDLRLIADVDGDGKLTSSRRDRSLTRPTTNMPTSFAGELASELPEHPQLVDGFDVTCGRGGLTYLLGGRCVAQDGDQIVIDRADDRTGRLLGADLTAQGDLIVAYSDALEALEPPGDEDNLPHPLRIRTFGSDGTESIQDFDGLGDNFMDPVMSVDFGPNSIAVSHWPDNPAQVDIYTTAGEFITTFGADGAGIRAGVHAGTLLPDGERIAFLDPNFQFTVDENHWKLVVADLESETRLVEVDLDYLFGRLSLDSIGDWLVISQEGHAPTVVNLAEAAYFITDQATGPTTIEQ